MKVEIEETMRINAREWQTSPLNKLREAAPLVLMMCDELAEVRSQRDDLLAACEKALAFHDRYCDRVGPAKSWAAAVHQTLRDAIARAKGA